MQFGNCYIYNFEIKGWRCRFGQPNSSTFVLGDHIDTRTVVDQNVIEHVLAYKNRYDVHMFVNILVAAMVMPSSVGGRWFGERLSGHQSMSNECSKCLQ